MNTKVVILNGPPNCGKDTLADLMYHEYTGAKVARRAMKDGLYDLTADLFLVDREWFRIVCADRARKEAPMKRLGGRSPREALIYVSEQVVKPAFGHDYFGRYAAENLEQGALNIFSDGGFVEEAIPVLNVVGADNVLLVQIYREGCSFDGDSRNYLPRDMFLHSAVLPNEKLSTATCELAHIISKFLGASDELSDALSALWD